MDVGEAPTNTSSSPLLQYKRISDKKLASHMKARLENTKKVKEKDPKLTGHEFELGDRVVAQNPLSKLWDTHKIVTKRHSKWRFRIQADEGNSFS